MNEYRITKSFEGYWTLELNQGNPSIWFTCETGSYNYCIKKYDEIMARESYVPVRLTPPFPDTDPTMQPKRKFFKWF